MMSRILCLALLGFAVDADALLAAPACGLTVHVLSGDKPAGFSRVRLIAPDGTVVRDDDVKGGEDRICEFGPRPHTLIVGGDGCYPTTIGGIRLDLDHPLEFSVRLNWCREEWSSANVCRLLLRVVDSLGLPIKDATATLPTRPPFLTDDYGRAQIDGLGEPKETVTIARPGYSALSVEFTCTKPRRSMWERRLLRAPLRPAARHCWKCFGVS